jgi:hypothetical protein
LIEGIHAFGEIKVRNTFMGETHAVAEAEFVRNDGISVPYSGDLRRGREFLARKQYVGSG